MCVTLGTLRFFDERYFSIEKKKEKFIDSHLSVIFLFYRSITEFSRRNRDTNNKRIQHNNIFINFFGDIIWLDRVYIHIYFLVHIEMYYL